jgi:hypothetical protein
MAVHSEGRATGTQNRKEVLVVGIHLLLLQTAGIDPNPVLLNHAEGIEFQKEISSSNFITESSFTLVFIFVSLFFDVPFLLRDLIYILNVLSHCHSIRVGI